MNIMPQDAILCKWMESLTKYIDYLAIANNPNNNRFLPELVQVLNVVGELLNLDEIRSNYLVRSHLCSITKERLQRAIRYAGGDYEQIKQTGCLEKINQKINAYLEETTKDIDFELDKKETDLSGKMLYLAVEGKLTKDTYELAKRNSMASGNFGAIISTFLAAEKNHQLNPNNPWEHYHYICQQIIDFHSGFIKLDNDQTFAANIAIFNYLTSKGYEPIPIAQYIGTLIREIYNKYNPYVHADKVYIDESTTIEFSHRYLFNRNMYLGLVQQYTKYIRVLPIELKSLLKKIVFENERNPDDIYWRQVYTANHNSGATCDQEHGIMSIYQFENDSTAFYNQEIAPSTIYRHLYHELGHAYDRKYAKEWGVETESISSSSLWLEAMKEDEALNKMTSVSDYGKNHPCEDFADSIEFYLVHPQYMEYFPNRKRLLDEKFKVKRLHPDEPENPGIHK